MAPKLTDSIKILDDKINSIQSSLDRIDKDLGIDRDDIHSFRLRLGALESVCDELRKGLKGQVDKMQDRTAELIQPLVDTNSDLKDSINNLPKESIIRLKKRSVWVKFKSWWTEGWK